MLPLILYAVFPAIAMVSYEQEFTQIAGKSLCKLLCEKFKQKECIIHFKPYQGSKAFCTVSIYSGIYSIH